MILGYVQAATGASAETQLNELTGYLQWEFNVRFKSDTPAKSIAQWTRDKTVCTPYTASKHDVVIAVERLDTGDREGPSATKAIHAELTNPKSVVHATVLAKAYKTHHIQGAASVADVHIANERIVFKADRGKRLTEDRRAVADALTGDQPDAGQLKSLGIPHQTGRPPIGTYVENGRLHPDKDYDQVCLILQRVQDGRVSKVQAANRLDCARKTIDNALERRTLYRLD